MVEYDGYGDEGQIGPIQYFDGNGNAIADLDLDDEVEDYLFWILPGGWEINEGSCGTVEIDVATMKAHVIHTQRVVEEYTEEYEDE